jgi:hypothetical protein
MGGLQTLNIALPHLDQFAYIGIFSSGRFNGSDAQFIKEHGAALDNATWKKGLKFCLWVWEPTIDSRIPAASGWSPS